MEGSAVREELEELSLRDRKLYWEALLKKAQTEHRELENGIKRGDYVKKSEAADELASFFTAFKQAALLLPRSIGILAWGVMVLMERGECNAPSSRAVDCGAHQGRAV